MTIETRTVADDLAEIVAAVVREWRSDNPAATTFPWSVRRRISQGLRAEAHQRRIDAAVTRNEFETAIFRHQKHVLDEEQHRAGKTPDEWGRVQERLSAARDALAHQIHESKLLSATERGHAIDALNRAHVTPRATVRVRWSFTTGLDALKARVTERVSAIRLGLADRVVQALGAPRFVAAQQEAAERTERAQTRDDGMAPGPAAWLTPAQSEAVADLTDTALRWERAAGEARAGRTPTDLTALISRFNEAMSRARGLGVSSERLNAELIATEKIAHRYVRGPMPGDSSHPQPRAMTKSERQAASWEKVQAAMGPLDPPAPAADAQSAHFAFTAAPKSAAGVNGSAVRHTR